MKIADLSSPDSPGAGNYSATNTDVYKKRCPAAVMTGRRGGVTNKIIGPSPASYFPKLNGPSYPKYSFGIAHNKCSRPYFTPMDGI
jgi:hypothetical protein